MPSLYAAAAVGLHVVGEHRIEQQRHVTEQVVEQVRLGQVIELVGLRIHQVTGNACSPDARRT